MALSYFSVPLFLKGLMRFHARQIWQKGKTHASNYSNPSTHQKLRQEPGHSRGDLRHSGRRGLRLPGPQRRRQNHHHAHAHGPAARHHRQRHHRRTGLLDTVHRGQKLVGYLPGEFSFDPGLCGAQIIEYLGHLRGGVDQAYLHSLVERLGWDPSKRFREYSHGNKQKLGLVQAFMHKPRLLILDEPTSGLDPLNQQEFYKMVAEVRADGRTVFLSSHILPEVEHTCDRVAIIREGRLVKIDHVSSLKDIHQHDVEISFPGPASVDWFKHVEGVVSVAQGADERTLQLNVQGVLTEIIRVASDHYATNMATREPTLEEVFLRFYAPEQEPSALAG